MLKLKFESFLKAYRNSLEPYKAEWIILFSMIGIMFFSHLYWDIVITTRHGINVWTSLFEGHLNNFYFDNTQPQITNYATSCAIYPFPVYIAFAIWNFPLWVMEHVFHKDPFTSTVALMYAKCILLPFLLGSAYLVKKICIQLSISVHHAKWCAFYFLSSNLVFFAVVVTGQYDIFSVFFILLGFYYYVKNDVQKFLLFFAIAFSFKLFAVFIFIPLLLLKEKRIFRILLYCIASLSIYCISSMIFPMPAGSSAIAINMIGRLFSQVLPLTFISTPIFVIATVCLWLFCYIKNPDEDNNRMALYVSFLAMAILFVCCYTNLYWIILLSPFVCMLCFTNQKYLKINMLIETLLCGTVIFSLDIAGSPVFSLYTTNNTFLSKIFGNIPYDKYDKYFGSILKDIIKNETVLSYLAPSCTAAFVAGLVVFSILNFRKEQSEQEVAVDRNLILSRLLINAFICGLPLILFLYYKFSS
ncbi:MAG: hypothetical protein BGN88_04745 [Clostridiales bacterium 43-6]|nr:MAG: hypothetical protein BGN88_04745 [Clostridiales bacterium 43-6]